MFILHALDECSARTQHLQRRSSKPSSHRCLSRVLILPEMLAAGGVDADEGREQGSKRPRGTRTIARVMRHDHEPRVSTLPGARRLGWFFIWRANGPSACEAPAGRESLQPPTSGINHATKQLCCKAWHRS